VHFSRKLLGSLIGNEDFDREENDKKKGNDQAQIADHNACRTIYVDVKNKVSPLTYPSTNKSSRNKIPNTSCRLSNSASESSKETPKTDVTFSSSLLRAGRSEGGATIGKCLLVAYDDTALENLKPKHLDLVFEKAEPPYSQDHHLNR